MRIQPFVLVGLLAGTVLAAVPTVTAGPSCGTPDEHINLTDTDIWYGGLGECTGVSTPPQIWCNSSLGVDRPYARVWEEDCGVTVVVQP